MQKPSTTSLGDKARDAFATILNQVLANESSLSWCTREYGKRITGPNLHSLFRVFSEQRRQLDSWLNRLGDCMRETSLAALGKNETPTGGDAKAAPPAAVDPGSMIRDLVARHEELARALQGEIAALPDPALAKLLQGLREFHETSAWMLRILQNGPIVPAK